MAVIKNAYRSGAAIKMNGGVSPTTGNMIVKSVSLGNMVAGADETKVMTVCGKMLAILKYPMIRIEQTEVVTLENA